VITVKTSTNRRSGRWRCEAISRAAGGGACRSDSISSMACETRYLGFSWPGQGVGFWALAVILRISGGPGNLVSADVAPWRRIRSKEEGVRQLRCFLPPGQRRFGGRADETMCRSPLAHLDPPHASTVPACGRSPSLPFPSCPVVLSVHPFPHPSPWIKQEKQAGDSILAGGWCRPDPARGEPQPSRFSAAPWG